MSVPYCFGVPHDDPLTDDRAGSAAVTRVGQR